MELEKSSFCKITPTIFIGNKHSSIDPTFLYGNNINIILNLTPDPGADCEDIVTHDLPITLRELFEDEIIRTEKILFKISQIITENSSKNILVYCDDGVNCSPLVVCYYLISSKLFDNNSAIELVTKANETRGAKTFTNVSYRLLIKDLKTQGS